MDPSGVRLRAWMGVSEAEFYESGRVAIAPMAFCFPGYDGTSPTGRGGDLPPPRVCAEIWRERVMQHVLPGLQVVLLVGAYAQYWHMGRRGRLTQTVERLREGLADGSALEQRPVTFPLPHPSWRNNAWLKRHPWFEREVVPALQSVVRVALR
jgi:uracil-DNA glycosylase